MLLMLLMLLLLVVVVVIVNVGDVAVRWCCSRGRCGVSGVVGSGGGRSGALWDVDDVVGVVVVNEWPFGIFI